jgi:hypothetical protein
MPASTRDEAVNGTDPAAFRPFSADDEGTDEDGNPTGLLMWGQAGVYNGVDDRAVITALIDNAIGGVVRPAGLSAGAGLNINVGAGWSAVASCGDGTNCVIGSRQSHVVTETAGPPAGTRNDLLWADTYPDDGRWVLRIIPEAQMPGRAGLPLGRIYVPAGANLASQMTFSQDVHFLSPKVDSDPRANHGSTAYADITPRYPFATYGMRRDALYRLTAFGVADCGSGTAAMRFAAGGAQLDLIPSRLGASMANRMFCWQAEVITTFGWRYAQGVGGTKLSVTLSRLNAAIDPTTSATGVRVENSVPFGAGPWLSLGLQMRWLAAMPNANLLCQSSSFEAVGKPW